ncbi:MAG TPA: hypothetical protein VNT99_00990, partial [Methylomirabilota bacterium]|nr:hypothetical protein [Methylomirabilota bacterium]
NRFLKGDDKPVTEPEWPKIEGQLLRAFPDELPADEINTTIDESFVPLASSALPQTQQEFQSWRSQKSNDLHRLVFRAVPKAIIANNLRLNDREESTGLLTTELEITVPWRFFPAPEPKPGTATWLVVLGEDESLGARPDWLIKAIGAVPVLLLSPRNSGAQRWPDPAPYYVRRSLPLLGRTVDGDRLIDVVAAARAWLRENGTGELRIVGRGSAGVLAAYAALLEPRILEVMAVVPPSSHRDGPILLNVLRVLDVPQAFGMLAPRPLTIATAQSGAFDATRALYQLGGGALKIESAP